MHLHDFQEGVGETGILGEVLLGLGILVGLAGVAILSLLGLGLFAPNDPSALVAFGGLFLLLGAGFTLVGIVALQEGWDRHHPHGPRW